MSSHGRYNHRKQGLGLMLLFVLGGMGSPAFAIDVALTLEQAQQIMASARGPMEQAASNDEMFGLIKDADKSSRIGDDPEDKPCGSSAILRTKTYWFEYFGREEGRRSQGGSTGNPNAGSQNSGNSEYAES